MSRKEKENIVILKKKIRQAKKDFDEAGRKHEEAETEWFNAGDYLKELQTQLTELTVIKKLKERKNK